MAHRSTRGWALYGCAGKLLGDVSSEAKSFAASAWKSIDAAAKVKSRQQLRDAIDAAGSELQRTRDAMASLGIDAQEQADVFRTVAAVLRVGNVGFEADDGGDGHDERIDLSSDGATHANREPGAEADEQ